MSTATGRLITVTVCGRCSHLPAGDVPCIHPPTFIENLMSLTDEILFHMTPARE